MEVRLYPFIFLSVINGNTVMVEQVRSASAHYCRRFSMKRILLSGWNACLSKNYPALSARIPIHTARRREVHASTMFLAPGLEPDCSIRNQPLHKPWPPCLSQYFLKAPVISILLCNINTGRLGCDTAICQHYRVS